MRGRLGLLGYGFARGPPLGSNVPRSRDGSHCNVGYELLQLVHRYIVQALWKSLGV